LKQKVSSTKKVLASLLAVFFVISVTAAAVSAKPVVVKEKITFIMMVQGENVTKFSEHNYSNNYSKDMVMNNGKDLAINSENGEIKTAKGVAINKETGEVKAAKGVAINSKTDNYKDGSSDDQAEIEMAMKYLEMNS